MGHSSGTRLEECSRPHRSRTVVDNNTSLSIRNMAKFGLADGESTLRTLSRVIVGKSSGERRREWGGGAWVHAMAVAQLNAAVGKSSAKERYPG